MVWSPDACTKDEDGDGWGEDLTNTCCFQLTMIDSYGNGWDGAELIIKQGSSTLFEITLEDGYEEEVEICVPKEEDLDLMYTEGSWESENSYILTDPDGTIVYSDGPYPSSNPPDIPVDFSIYTSDYCHTRTLYDSGEDCNDFDATQTGEDKDGDGSTLCDGDCDDYDPMMSSDDLDKDGYSRCTGDCNDNDPTDMLDLDGDGYTVCDGDCNDYTSLVNPAAIELVQDNTDQNCDGVDQEIMVASGNTHTCAIDIYGALGCWGDEFAISDAPSDGFFRFIAAGKSTTVAIQEDGTLSCFGSNCDNLPDQAFQTVSQGEKHGCGVANSGELYCWGSDEAIGEIPEGLFVQVAVGSSSCALTRGQELHCWGIDDYDEVSSKPDGLFRKVSAGKGQFCALDELGKTICWGDTGDDSLPINSNLFLSVGTQSGCSMNEGGMVSCWGLSQASPVSS